jgi:hypothetical protein
MSLLTTTQTGYWLDANERYSLSNPLEGSSSMERWIASQGTNGTTSSAQTMLATYQHQYFIQIEVAPASAGSVSAISNWYDASSQLTLTATPAIGFSFGSWTSSNASLSVLRLDSPSTVLTVGGPGTLAANFSTTITTSTTAPTHTQATSFQGTTSASQHSTSRNQLIKGIDNNILIASVAVAVGVGIARIMLTKLKTK